MGSKRQRIVVDPQTLAHLQGKHLEAPSSVIPELEEAHGPNKILHGKFKVCGSAWGLSLLASV